MHYGAYAVLAFVGTRRGVFSRVLLLVKLLDAQSMRRNTPQRVQQGSIIDNLLDAGSFAPNTPRRVPTKK